MTMYDIAIIGAGWAGYTAALAAQHKGLRVCLIEERAIGGTCLNLGCIPTKALLQSAHVLETVGKASAFGIADAGSAHADFAQVQARKDKLVQQLAGAMKARLGKTDYLAGRAEFSNGRQIEVEGKKIEARNILLCTGSRPVELADFPFDGRRILSSDHMLAITEVPETLLIIGGGVIGCEFAQLFSLFGTQVTVVEITDQLLPGMDQDAAKKLETSFKKKRIKVLLKTDARSQDISAFEKILVCVGRKARLEGLEPLGVATNARGILVDEFMQTSVPNIFAAGDCTGGFMLAHYAAYQGELALHSIAEPDFLARQSSRAVPSCVYTSPEIACVGLSEKEARSHHAQVQVFTFDLVGSGMARIMDETDGFVKIVSDAQTDRVLGAALVGPRATELIAVLTVALAQGLSVADLKKVIFAHPTVSEAIAEALRSNPTRT